ncbi:MAG: family 78 glycoside hydrolase catalytic domain [Kiritimatiellia bacterium]
MKKTFSSGLAAVAVMALAAGGRLYGEPAAPAAPCALTVELLPNPCGVDAAAPRLAWKQGRERAGARRDVSQSAYRVLVASTPERLARDEGDLWDSGKVASSQSIDVRYAGKPLASSQRVHWKVRTWCQAGQASAWSRPQTFVTGLMRPADWRAKWIGPAACTRPDEDFGAAQWITAPADGRGVATLEYAFDFAGAKPGEYVEMVHAGVSQHEIDVNGKPFNKWSGHVHDWRFLRFRDMTPWLVKGRNRIVVRLFADKPRGAGDPVDPIRQHAPKDARAFLAKIVLPDGRTLVTGTSGWTSPGGAVTALGGVRAPAWGADMVLRAENASPAFAKTFAVAKPLASAILHVTGVGFYEAWLNGRKIGDKVLDPSPTVFDRRVLYSTYDLGRDVAQGPNELKILVGHGWYDMRAVATWNFETAPWRNFPRAIAQLELVYADGTKETVVTDGSWRQVKSPLGHDDIFEGEVLGGWNPRMPDLEKTVVRAEEVPAPGKLLTSEMHAPAKVMRTFPAQEVHALGNGTYVIDAGENVAGWIRLDLRGQRPGDVVSFRYDERVNDDFSPAAPSVHDGLRDFAFSNRQSAAGAGEERRKVDAHFRYTASHRACAVDAAFQTDRVVCSGAAVETYEPRFVYHGFRYVVVKGLARAPSREDVAVRVVHTAFPTIGSFACSDATFNALMRMGEKAYRGNFADGVPTDCPHREKNGWTGDASIASELAQYLFENTAAYEKWLRDIGDSQLENGNIPGIVPSSGWGYHWGNGPAWDSALPVVAWNLWIYRGDRRILDEVYPVLEKYLAYTASRADADGLVKHGLGDWVPVNRAHMPSTELTSSCYYFQALSIAAKVASLKGLDDAAARYAARAETVKRAINRKFYKGGGVYDNGYQSAQAFPLAYGIVPAGELDQVAARLVAAVDAAGGHVDVGLLGSKHVFRALSRIGRSDLAFRMLTNPTAPSPVEWLQKGGTTLWEDWNDGSSRNHIMFGDFVGWAYQYLAGIRLAEAEGSTSAVTVPTAPAFKELVIAPQVVPGLTWVRARVDGPYGEIVSSWRLQGGAFTLNVTVPPNASAKVRLPDGSERRVGSGDYAFACNVPVGGEERR